MNICVLLVPYDSGRLAERMGRGPEHLLETSIADCLTGLGHKFRVESIQMPAGFTAEIQNAFAVCRSVAERVRKWRADGWFPLVLSGNCNTAVGTVSGCGCEETGVVWFDAHGEATTPETPTSGFLDGMGISTMTGECWRTLARSIPGFAAVKGERIVLVGSRELEDAEVALLDAAGVRRVSGREPLGDAVVSDGTDGSYLHFDLDVLDPSEAVTNQWAPEGGLTVAAVRDAAAEVRRRSRIKAIGVASYDPEADRDGRGARAAAAILEAALGAG
jgi:arginase